jgi:phosphoribosylanthranilate isomerase
MRIKICGITDSTTAQAIALKGADTLGFICVAQSPRYVTPTTITTIIQALPEEISTIGVFVNASPEDIATIVTTTGLTGIQLHGEETPETCAKLRELLPNREIIKVFRVRDLQSLEPIESYYPVVDTILLDTYHPDSYGGTGKQLNWHELSNFRPPRPWLLAGGITPDNVITALHQVNCDGIDISSGVEIAPGQKDLAKVSQLFQALVDYSPVKSEDS